MLSAYDVIFMDKNGESVLKLCKLGAIRARNEIKLQA